MANCAPSLGGGVDAYNWEKSSLVAAGGDHDVTALPLHPVQSKNTLYSMRKIQDVLWMAPMTSERPSVATTEDSRDHCSSIDYYSDPPLSEGSNRYGMCMHTLVQAG